MTFQIVTDSCCDLPYTWLKEKNIPFISMTITIDGQDYIDDLGENFKTEWFIKKLKEGKLPTTSQINPQRYYDFFLPYVKQNIPLLYLAFSSGLSGSYQSALQAVEMVKEDYPTAEITVIDTKNASLGEGLVVYHANRLFEEGKSLPEIIDWVTTNSPRVHSYVKVDDLDHLKRGGRISKTAAVVGSLMNIKPLLIMDEEGKLKNVGKARGTNRALEKLVQDTIATMENPEENVIFIAHSNALEEAELVKTKLQEKLSVKDYFISPLGSVISSHTGLGCVAVFSIGTPR